MRILKSVAVTKLVANASPFSGPLHIPPSHVCCSPKSLMLPHSRLEGIAVGRGLTRDTGR